MILELIEKSVTYFKILLGKLNTNIWINIEFIKKGLFKF